MNEILALPSGTPKPSAWRHGEKAACVKQRPSNPQAQGVTKEGPGRLEKVQLMVEHHELSAQ